MPKLVFIDDDPAELDAMRPIAEREYAYTGIRWPLETSLEEAIGEPPDVIVLDLYLPPKRGVAPTEIPKDEHRTQAAFAERVAECFAKLYAYHGHDDKNLLQETMKCIQKAYELLEKQWTALGQSPDNGIQLLADLKAHARYGQTPVVFYSRKITPEDIVRVLRAGAVDAIRKGVSDAEVLRRLREARELFGSGKAVQARAIGLNVNTTL